MNARWMKALALMTGLVFTAAACGSDDSAEPAATTVAVADDAMEDDAMEDDAMEDDAMEDDAMEDADPDDEIAHFSIVDGHSLSFAITSCEASGESTITLAGESDKGTTISVEATDLVGSIVIDGPEGSYEGSVDSVVVGDTGRSTVSGAASEADDSATGGAKDFELNGFACA